MYPLYAVIMGREYSGEDFNSLRLFTNAEDAEEHVRELEKSSEPDTYIRLDRVYVDYGVGG